MIDNILNCKKCSLYQNQLPLLDFQRNSKIFWVGLSAKLSKFDDEIPLSYNTNTGKLIKKIEDSLHDIPTYKTNIVKCVPLNNKNKLRYPNKVEIDTCFSNLLTEINELSPTIVFLLGEKVYSSVERHFNIKFKKWTDFDYVYTLYNGIYYIPIHHPSYIHIYKKKQIDEYVNSIVDVTKILTK